MYGGAKGVKWAYLENLSMTTRIVSTCLDFGSPSMKSKLTVCQALGGMGNGCKSPGNLPCSGLA